MRLSVYSLLRVVTPIIALGLLTPEGADAQFQNIPGALVQISVGADGAVWGLNSGGGIYTFNSQTQTWTQLPGALAEIAAGSASAVWGINASGYIYRWDASKQGWDWIPGNLSQIAVGADGDVWGINSQSHIYEFNAQSQSWQQIPGSLRQIAVGFDGAVWGINWQNSVYRFNPGVREFQQAPGTMTSLAAGADGDVWGLNNGSVFHFDRLRQNWDAVPGNLSQISVGAGSNVWGLDGAGQAYQYDAQSGAFAAAGAAPLAKIAAGANGAVWGLDGSDAIYRFSGATAPAQIFREIPGQLATVAAGSDGSVWALNSAGQIYTYNPLTQGWTNVAGQLAQIAVGTGQSVWGINSGNQIYRYDAATQNWDLIPGSLSQIAVGANGDIWGLNSGDQIYRYNPATQGWTSIPGALRQIAVGADGSVWGLNSANQIYEFNAAKQSWTQIPGSLTQITLGSAGNVWGINSEGAVYRFNPQSRLWSYVPGVFLTQIAAAFDGAVWGITAANQIFAFSVQTAAWTLVAGSVSNVVVASDATVFALDSSGSVYYRVQAPAASQGLTLISVSNTSPQPLTPIYVAISGLNLNASISVHFSDQLGYAVTQAPLRVQPDGTIAVGVPIYFDPNINDSRPASVSLVITQGSYSTSPVSINIQDLPHLADYGTQLGAVSRSFFNYAAISLAHRMNELQALNSFPGNTVDASQAIGNLNKLMISTIEARADIDNVSQNHALVLAAGTLSDGTALQFDQHSLDMMDRVLAMYLTQMAPYILSSPSGPEVRGGESRAVEQLRPRDAGSTLASVLSKLTFGANATGLATTAQSYVTSDKTWVDKTLAAGGALAGILGFAKQAAPDNPFIQTSLGIASAGLGAGVGLLSMLNDIGQELGAGAYLLVYSNSENADPEVLEEAAKDLGNANNHLVLDSIQTELSLFDYGVSSGSFEGTAAAAFDTQIAQSIQNKLESDGVNVALQSSYLVTNVANFALSGGFDSQKSIITMLSGEISSVFNSASQGFAQLVGTADVSNSLGIYGALPGAEVYSDLSDSFSTLGDTSGNYDLWMPLQDSNFDYSNSDFEIYDPVSDNTINTVTLNLNALNTNTPFDVPTIMGSCIDDDAGNPDSDDPDCDSTAQFRRPISTSKAVRARRAPKMSVRRDVLFR